MGELNSTSTETRWVYQIMHRHKKSEYGNQKKPFYMRTLDDILPQLSKAKTISMADATSGYWQVPLDLASSLLTTFSTPLW